MSGKTTHHSYPLGIDVGGSGIKAAPVDLDKGVFASKRKRVDTPQPATPDSVIEVIATLVEHFADQVGDAPIGVTVPAVVTHGTVRSAANIDKAWIDFEGEKAMAKALGREVTLINDADAAGYGELHYGAAVNENGLVILTTLGTGIGAGLILNNALYRGRSDLAGEIGHVVIFPDGPLCVCGKRGCLEALASGTALGRRGREEFGDETLTAHDVCARARLDDPLASSIIADAALALGIGLANLLHTLNLERIVLGTLAVHAADLLLEPIRAATEVHCWPEIWQGVSIVPAALGDAAQDKAALAAALQ